MSCSFDKLHSSSLNCHDDREKTRNKRVLTLVKS